MTSTTDLDEALATRPHVNAYFYETALYESGGQSDLAAFEQVGFGQPIHTVTPLVLHPAGLEASWGGVLLMIAEQLGITVDEITCSHEMLPSPETFAYQVRTIEEGTIAGLRFERAAIVGGVNRISVRHITRARPDLARHWPRPVAQRRLPHRHRGRPDARGRGPVQRGQGRPPRRCFGITAMRSVSAIPLVMAAERRVVPVFDPPIISAKGRFQV